MTAGIPRHSPIDRARVVALKAQGLTKTQIAERLGCSFGGVSHALKRHGRDQTMREGDVLVVRRVLPGQQVPRGFARTATRLTHHDRHAMPVTKLVRAKANRTTKPKGD